MNADKSSEPWYYARQRKRNRLRDCLSGVSHVVIFLSSGLCDKCTLDREKVMAKVRSEDEFLNHRYNIILCDSDEDPERENDCLQG